MINWNSLENPIEILQEISKRLWDLDYRITGLTAVNLYGYGLSTDVFDVAVVSDEAVIEACKALDLEYDGDPDPYLYYNGDFYIRIQGDIMGEPFVHPLGLKLHSKELLIRRLEIYGKHCARTLQACAWIALTKDAETALKYKEYWNRL